MSDIYAGELVIEFPKHDPEGLRPLVGWQCAAYEYRFGDGLKMLDNVTHIKLNLTPSGQATADVTRTIITPSENAPGGYVIEDEVTTWLVVDARERAS